MMIDDTPHLSPLIDFTHVALFNNTHYIHYLIAAMPRAFARARRYAIDARARRARHARLLVDARYAYADAPRQCAAAAVFADAQRRHTPIDARLLTLPPPRRARP